MYNNSAAQLSLSYYTYNLSRLTFPLKPVAGKPILIELLPLKGLRRTFTYQNSIRLC